MRILDTKDLCVEQERERAHWGLLYLMAKSEEGDWDVDDIIIQRHHYENANAMEDDIIGGVTEVDGTWCIS